MRLDQRRMRAYTIVFIKEVVNLKTSKQMSESIELGIVLALAGGFMDAYSYICRDHVFANAQTGNMLLLGINMAEGRWSIALRYLLPVLAFVIGIALAEIIKFNLKNKNLLHWRQVSILWEVIVLFIVGFIPETLNLLANSLTSFACGIQVESFRKIQGYGIATTMCIGNIRSGTQNICEFFHTGIRENMEKGLLYFGIILCFIIGAIIGNYFIKLMSYKAIIICSAILFIAFVMMFKKAKTVQ